MAKHDKAFRDIDTRMTRAQKMEETVMLGGSGGHAGGTLMLDGGGIEKPMLGRYEVEKELGKGAMGVVYLGKDPKINRVVAIKTMKTSSTKSRNDFFARRKRLDDLTIPTLSPSLMPAKNTISPLLRWSSSRDMTWLVTASQTT
jgi:serine/threonine-protein kinase